MYKEGIFITAKLELKKDTFKPYSFSSIVRYH
jgi:hypothetical protein